MALLNPAYGIGHLVVAIEAWEKSRNQVRVPHPMFQADPGLPVVLSRIGAGDFEKGTGDGVPSKAMLEVWVEVHPGTSLDDLTSDFLGNLQRVAAQTPVIQK